MPLLLAGNCLLSATILTAYLMLLLNFTLLQVKVRPQKDAPVADAYSTTAFRPYD
jgi:hypothetical protein